jgi:hypothetical protein
MHACLDSQWNRDTILEKNETETRNVSISRYVDDHGE